MAARVAVWLEVRAHRQRHGALKPQLRRPQKTQTANAELLLFD
ncbi:hypothetical protein ACWC2T_37380 [Streptomyces sp. NPDC001393]